MNDAAPSTPIFRRLRLENGSLSARRYPDIVIEVHIGI
jgi:hypothetical protein